MAATLLALLTIPLVILLWATEARPARIQRMRDNGWTWQRIGDHFGVSRTTARRWAAA